MDRARFLLLIALAAHFFTTFSAVLAVANNNNIHDLDALLAFKATVVDPQNILQTNWTNSTSICNWIGITCNIRHQRVASIYLPHMGLIGTIPPHVGNLSFLIQFNLSHNDFHGELPKELANLRRLKYISIGWNDFHGNFPSWLGCLSELRYLSIPYNRFSGFLSGKLSNATRLETINLSDNDFTGNIPVEFGYLKNLKVLWLVNNTLTGPLPQAWFNISSLQILECKNNSLSGYLPARICQISPQLEVLDLSRNQIQGEIPSSIGNCTSLWWLDLSHNNIVGRIPREIWNLTMLTVINLAQNSIEGLIPQAANNLKKLKVFNLAVNKLSGPIPLELFNISTLQVIALGANNLSGNLPSTLGVNLPNLQQLYLGSNKLSGFVLTFISNSSSLKALVLGENSFTGPIPHSLGNLRLLELIYLEENNFSLGTLSGEMSFLISMSNCRHLRILDIGDNPLDGFLPFSIGNLSGSIESIFIENSGIKGGIPSSIGNLTKLVNLFLATNDLIGKISTTIKGLSKLQSINLGGNKIEGSIPSEFCHLSNLASLDLSGNRLSGKLPSCIGSIVSLRYLYLYSNNLTSNIPASFWSLKYTLEMDLSRNSLTGSLPFEIKNLEVLVSMNLSMNRLVGKIPGTIGELQNLQELNLEHNNLEGSIPDSIKKMSSLKHLDLSFNNLDGVIPDSLEILSYLEYFNVSYNKLKGPIPNGGPFKKFTALSFLANEALCGAPWFRPCETSEHKSRNKRIVLFVMFPVGSVMLVLAISFLVIRKLRRKTVPPTHDDMFSATKYEWLSFHQLQRITDGFNERNLLGYGTFGSVYKGICEDGMIWAVKVFDMKLESAFKSFDKECEILCLLRHRNLIKVISACSNQDFKALVLEYMPNGSLEKRLHLDHHILNITQRLDIMIDVACGLEYLHYGYSIPVIHCDLKPSNILLDQDMVGRICDFGITKLLGDGENVVQTRTLATLGYIAPEYGLDGLVSTRCDVYSFGIILMETFTRRRPTDEMFTEKLTLKHWIQELLLDSVILVVDVKLLDDENDHVKEKLACISPILQLALSCTTDAPEERPNIKDVLVELKKIKFHFIRT